MRRNIAAAAVVLSSSALFCFSAECGDLTKDIPLFSWGEGSGSGLAQGVTENTVLAIDFRQLTAPDQLDLTGNHVVGTPDAGATWDPETGIDSGSNVFAAEVANVDSFFMDEGDFTIELWMDQDSPGSNGSFRELWLHNEAFSLWWERPNSFFAWNFRWNIDASATEGRTPASAKTASHGSGNLSALQGDPGTDGHHICMMRSGNTAYMFVKGVRQGTLTWPLTNLQSDIYFEMGPATGPLLIGEPNGRYYAFRMIRGEAIYSTSGFTEPSIPF